MTLDDLVSNALRERAARAPDPDTVSTAALEQGRKRRTRRKVAGLAGVAAATTGLALGGVALGTGTHPAPTEQVPVANASAATSAPHVPPNGAHPECQSPNFGYAVYTTKTPNGASCIVLTLVDGKMADTWPPSGGTPLGPPDKNGVRTSADGRVAAKQRDANHWLAAAIPPSFPVVSGNELDSLLDRVAIH